MPAKQTLGKDQRLKSRKRIEAIFKDGKKFTVFPFRIFFQAEKTGKSELQIGVGVSGKFFRKAVDRNRIKRLIKESWRVQIASLKEKLTSEESSLFVFIIYTSGEMLSYKEVHKGVLTVIAKLEEKLSKS
ncbi:MAG TPA: ribonuclease P protein component [Chitinophagaceae bacterium]|nr:ribonuclease P protein component [Chitinophagaceae bacterium]MCB9055280.1 ribonuclease P protein component [Chitinophagales bacterium]HRX92584.1 ribonuclease P protein component [Chitinophagaceae bacterium]